jgi:hypothetical protein
MTPGKEPTMKTPDIPTVRAVGSRGDWTATIPEWGVVYGVSHFQFCKGKGAPLPLSYREVCDDRRMPDHAQRLAKDGRVILSTDEPTENGGFRRTGYVAIYAITNVAYNDSTYELTFDCIEKLATCQ